MWLVKWSEHSDVRTGKIKGILSHQLFQKSVFQKQNTAYCVSIPYGIWLKIQ